MVDLKDRFLKYVSFDTQSDEMSETFPSTEKQKVLLKYLVEEMKSLGLTEVEMDEHSYAMGTIPATPGYEDRPVIGFISHVDTSPDMSGANIKPQIIENYDGKDIRLNENLMMTVKDFPELSAFKGHTLITTDGTTLLGADDKAGVAEIMTAAEYLMAHPEIKHGKIRIGFTPDEEVGRGVDYFNVEKFGAKFAYTIDGGFEGELEYENFNAARAIIRIKGKNVHPGSAKNVMKNAALIGTEIASLLPERETPAKTEGYEGFFHLCSFEGDVTSATLNYIIRDFNADSFAHRKELLRLIVERKNAQYNNCIELDLRDEYYNMLSQIEPHMEIISLAKQAMLDCGITPIIQPIRGGTDGARLSYMGLPCPNLGTGGHNFHGPYECITAESMDKAVEIILNIIALYAA